MWSGMAARSYWGVAGSSGSTAGSVSETVRSNTSDDVHGVPAATSTARASAAPNDGNGASHRVRSHSGKSGSWRRSASKYRLQVLVSMVTIRTPPDGQEVCEGGAKEGGEFAPCFRLLDGYGGGGPAPPGPPPGGPRPPPRRANFFLSSRCPASGPARWRGEPPPPPEPDR